MPKLGLTMSEGLLTEWRISPGDRFNRGDILAVIESDKSALELEAEQNGIIVELLAAEGESVECGAPLARWSTDVLTEITTAPASSSAAPVQSQSRLAAYVSAPVELRRAREDARGRVHSTPLARRVAREMGINIEGVLGSGPNGRITAADVKAFEVSSPDYRPIVLGAETAPTTEHHAETSPTQITTSNQQVSSKCETPQFYLSSEAEVSVLMETVNDLNALGGRTLTINDFLLAAVGRSLFDHPMANRFWNDNEILSLNTIDVGIAVEAPSGLIVAVLHRADEKSLRSLSREAAELAEQARGGQLRSSHPTGGAITVSDTGVHNVTWMAPVINSGQSSALGVGGIRRVFRPDKDGLPALRVELSLVLTVDRRVLGSVLALEFLDTVISYLEQPLRLCI